MIKNYIELIDIEEIEFTEEYDNMVDIQIDVDESFCLSNGITSHNSALSTCLSGFSVTGKKYYGAYPLKGKIINVRTENLNKIKENEEIKNIISALGLEFGKKYENTKSLRYGKLVIMTDADCINGETYIKTKRGNVKIKNINYGDEILTHNNKYEKIKNIIKTHKEKFIKINYNGNELEFGENHKLIILRDGEVIQEYTKNILKTDFLLIKKPS